MKLLYIATAFLFIAAILYIASVVFSSMFIMVPSIVASGISTFYSAIYIWKAIQ